MKTQTELFNEWEASHNFHVAACMKTIELRISLGAEVFNKHALKIVRSYKDGKGHYVPNFSAVANMLH